MIRKWQGRSIELAPKGLEGIFSNKPIQMELTEDAARKLALCLAKLKQTTLMVPPEVEEILTALNYVLVGDPASQAAHRQMEASKGMEPSGG